MAAVSPLTRLRIAWNKENLRQYAALKRTGLSPKLRILSRHDSSHDMRVGFLRDDAGLTLSIHGSRLVGETWPAVYRVTGLAYVLSRCEPGVRGVAEFSDHEAGGPGIVSFCSGRGDSILVPDPDFVLSDGYADERAMGLKARRFAERQDVVLWRGSTTGRGHIWAEPMTPDAPGLSLRTRMCLMLRDVPGCDVKFSTVLSPWFRSGDDRIAPPDPREEQAAIRAETERVRGAGILGGQVVSSAWLDVRYHIAIDGFSLAWSSTFTRLLMGCCVLKPESLHGYRQWYSAAFMPWEHYVPVAGDLSDLREKIEWCRSHVAQAADIAARGQLFAMSRYLAKEVADTAGDVNRAYARGMGLQPEVERLIPAAP